MRIFINGCFDCFHDGHKQLFDFAKYLLIGHCDYDIKFTETFLYVAINSDKSYISLRKNKPKDNETVRLKNIKKYLNDIGLNHVYYNIFDTEEQLKWIIDSCCPTFILKGHDYSDLTKVVGFPKWPILVKLRGQDINKKDISSTEIKNNENSKI
jgi:bifunctional ADP-heptose synthase (sugar kinase/adenylyltransferase)